MLYPSGFKRRRYACDYQWSDLLPNNRVCRIVGVSKNTLFRWLKDGVFSDIEYRDWRGWRLFTAAQVESIKTKTSHVNAVTRKS